jgi:hypothetical protein
MHYRHLLRDINNHIRQRAYHTPDQDAQSSINIDQRSLLDEAIAQAFPLKQHTQELDEEANTVQKDVKTSSPHTHNYYDVLAEIEAIIKNLNQDIIDEDNT